jgi:hypothetical protein
MEPSCKDHLLLLGLLRLNENGSRSLEALAGEAAEKNGNEILSNEE